MAFATNEERLSLANSGDFPALLSVQILTRDGKEVEIAADSVDNALDISGEWVKKRNAKKVEIFRVDPNTGEINKTIGPAYGYIAI